MTGRAAKQRTDSRQNFLEVKRLGYIVVGAGVKTLNLVAPAITRGQNKDRHRTPVAAPGFQHRDAIHLRQADIEDDRIIRLAVAKEVAFFTIERAIDHISG